MCLSSGIIDASFGDAWPGHSLNQKSNLRACVQSEAVPSSDIRSLGMAYLSLGTFSEQLFIYLFIFILVIGSEGELR
jgi:hypothetical protein